MKKFIDEDPEDPEPDETEKAIDEVADKITRKVELKLGLNQSRAREFITSKIYSEIDLNKDLSGYEGGDKILAFAKAMFCGDYIAMKSLSEGVAADGGVLVPDELSREIAMDLADPVHMRNLVKVVEAKRDVLKIPKVGSKPKMRFTSENATKSTTTADFSEKTITIYKMANILYLSEELQEDSEIAIIELVVKMFSDAIAEKEDEVISQGSGTGQPTGLTNCSIGSIACSGNLSFDNLINLIYLLPAKYRANATILASNENIRELRKMKDLQDRYLWQEPLAPDQPATFHGKPVVENNWIGNDRIYFGDFKQLYWLADRRRITVTVSPIAGTAWEKDQIGVRVVERIGGNCVLENSCRVLTGIP